LFWHRRLLFSAPLYIAQGIGSILGGPLAALLRQETGSWLPVVAIIIAMDALTGILALAVLKPMRRAYATEAHLTEVF
jgi:MFS transporter, OFA family, oxalate/formate antiporter